MIDADGWKRISGLFDELIDQPAGDRQRRIDEAGLPAEETALLHRWLAASDSPDTLLLDAAVDELAADLLQDGHVPPMSIPEGRHFGHWRALELIGRGGMGLVMRGERADGRFEKSVAIKLLPPGPVAGAGNRRFQAEIRTLAKLEHPDIARLLDGGVTDDGLAYLVMEHVPGQPVDRYANERGLDLTARVALVRRVAQAVAYCHRQLVVHCDIKPSNVLVTDDGRVRLVDFGIASILSDHPEHQELRPTMRCSPAYASPEQLTGAPPSVAQDVFGLGALLCLLLTGRPVRDAREATGLMLEITAPRPLSPLPAGNRLPGTGGRLARGRRADLEAIRARAVAHDVQQRYNDVGAFINDLDNWLAGHPVHARPCGALYRAGCWMRRHRAAAAGGILALVSLVAGAGIAGWQATQARAETQRAESEARRATAALAETRVALNQAEALHEFLIGLFRAAQPDLPPDQLPDTEAILELGARRALDEQTADPVVRLGMLLAIAGVYTQQNRHEQATSLLLAAKALARETGNAGKLAEALHGLGLIAQRERRLHDAGDYLQQAQEAAYGNEDTWNAWAWSRNLHGANELLLGNVDRARQMLEPLEAEVRTRESVPPHLLADILGELASAYRLQGELDRSLTLRREVADIHYEHFGPDSLDYALSMSNLATLYHQLGHFEAAEQSARDSLASLDRIYRQPIMFRVTTRANLALMLLYQGRFEEAEAELLAASEERAKAWNRPLETLEVHFYQRGSQLLGMRRWADAERNLWRARELYAQQPRAGAIYLILVDAALAMVLCEQGKVDQGGAILDEMHQRLDGALPEDPTQRAQIHHTRASCALQRNELELALAEADLALVAQTQPGRAPDRAERKLLRARILAALGQAEAAAAALDQAERLLLDVGLPQHPALDRISAGRTTLLAEYSP